MYKHIDTVKYRNYTDEDIITKAKEVNCMSNLLRALGLQPVGGNFKTIKKQIHLLKIDTSHWLTKQGWSLGRQFKDYSDYKNNDSIKKHLIIKKGHKCENCNLAEWLSKPIPLELDHIDGDNLNNEFNNLKLLCPNCHSLTPNWRGKALFGRSRERLS